MLRKATSIECYTNIICLSYASTKILPYSIQEFSHLKNKSAQQVRFILKAIIDELLFLKGFGAKLQNIKKIKDIYIACKSAINQNLAS